MVILSLDEHMSEGNTLEKMKQYRERDEKDRASHLYEAMFHCDDYELYVGNEMGVRGLLVFLAGTYIPYRGQIASSFISFEPEPHIITVESTLIEITSRGSDAPSMNEIINRGLATLKKELGEGENDPRFTDLAEFCMADSVSIIDLPDGLKNVPQIGAVEWLAFNRTKQNGDISQIPAA